MKFDITIKDATLSEIEDVVAKLGAKNAMNTLRIETPAPVAAPAPLAQLTPQAAVSMAAAHQAATESDVAESNGEGKDADGLPWDARIHSSSKKKTAKGVWARRRGVEDAEYNSVKMQILAQGTPAPAMSYAPAPAPMPAPVAPIPTGAPIVGYVDGQPVYATAVAAQGTATMYAAPPAPTPPPPAPAPMLQAGTRDFNNIMTRVQQGFMAGKCGGNFVHEVIQAVVQNSGVAINAITDVNGNQQLIDITHAVLDQKGL